MTKILTVLASILIASAIGSAQPKFEVASVKRAERCSYQKSMDAGMIRLGGMPLTVLMMEGYSVNMDGITGPSWLEQDCFDIVAKMPEGATKDQLPAMLQALLVERFKLVAHKESRPSPGYALVVDKNGPKFKQSDTSTPAAAARAGQVSFGQGSSAAIKGSMGMATLVRFLSRRIGSPIEDSTGLKGRYDIDLTFAPEASPDDAPPSVLSSVFTAVREMLGLKLEPRKESVETLVLDRIERVPSEN